MDFLQNANGMSFRDKITLKRDSKFQMNFTKTFSLLLELHYITLHYSTVKYSTLYHSSYLLARRHLVTERHREELDEVSNKRLTSMAYDVANGLAFLHEQK